MYGHVLSVASAYVLANVSLLIFLQLCFFVTPTCAPHCKTLCERSQLQIWVDGPAMDNYIALPDASGVLVVEALEPLYINTSGTVILDQSQIIQVGQLIAGSIGRSFGELHCYSFLTLLTPCLSGWSYALNTLVPGLIANCCSS